MSPPTEPERKFVEYLRSLVDTEDRAALAALRRGLGRPPGSVPELCRYVVPWAPTDGPSWHEDIYYLVAALFALHQGSWPPGVAQGPTNLGASFRRLAETSRSESVEKRFVALLSVHPDDLPAHLRHAVSLLKAHDVPVDWAQLLHDLRDWGHEDRFVQRDWARAFWVTAPADGQPTQPALTAAGDATTS